MGWEEWYADSYLQNPKGLYSVEEVLKPDTVPENRTGYWRKVQEIPRLSFLFMVLSQCLEWHIVVVGLMFVD